MAHLFRADQFQVKCEQEIAQIVASSQQITLKLFSFSSPNRGQSMQEAQMACCDCCKCLYTWVDSRILLHSFDRQSLIRGKMSKNIHTQQQLFVSHEYNNYDAFTKINSRKMRLELAIKYKNVKKDKNDWRFSSPDFDVQRWMGKYRVFYFYHQFYASDDFAISNLLSISLSSIESIRGREWWSKVGVR